MNKARMTRVAEMIAVFARCIELDDTNDEKKSTLWLIRRYCQEYEQLLEKEEEE